MNDTVERPCDVIQRRLREIGQSQGWLAMRLSIDRHYASRLVNGSVRISARMALRLAEAFGDEPEFWARLQADSDVERAKAASDNSDVAAP